MKIVHFWTVECHHVNTLQWNQLVVNTNTTNNKQLTSNGMPLAILQFRTKNYTP
jgi:hypothetical protein